MCGGRPLWVVRKDEGGGGSYEDGPWKSVYRGVRREQYKTTVGGVLMFERNKEMIL